MIISYHFNRMRSDITATHTINTEKAVKRTYRDKPKLTREKDIYSNLLYYSFEFNVCIKSTAVLLFSFYQNDE